MAAAAYLARTLTIAVGRLSETPRRLTQTPYNLDSAGFLQRLVSALLVYCLETARRDANTHKLLQLRHPNTVALQIGRENPRHHFRDVPAYATFLLGQTTPVNHAASHRSGSCDVTNFHVAKKAA
jgi:hypothetical protein